MLNVASALRFQASLLNELWSYCALTAGYLINRTPSMLLNGKTPYELLYNKAPPTNHLKVFGCLCYVHNQKHGGDKFKTRSNKSVFIGYPFGKKRWGVNNLETGKFSVYRDVIFCKIEFPFHDFVSSPTSDQAIMSLPSFAAIDDTIDVSSL